MHEKKEKFMRAPFQILAIPYKKEKELLYCVLQRADSDQWQFIAGGGEDDETPKEAAIREIYEEAGVENADVIELVSMAYVPANVIKECHRKYWAKDMYVLPEYHFAFLCNTDIMVSKEHTEYVWLSYEEAMKKLTWDSNRTALYELNCRLEGSV